MKSPKDLNVYFNQSFDKKRLKALISWVFKKSGEAEALRVLDLLKETGFKNATKAGISIGLHDLTTPVTKSWLISESQQSMNSTEIDFVGAKITATERSQRIIDTWHRASESLSKQVVNYFSIYDRFNPVYIMALSGARGNFSQVRQLIGMRGLMADQQGKIVNFPIRSNLREGLTITEYFISCSGARKGLVDTALRTADTGYLTRRLVDVSHHVVVKRIRCNTSRGIQFKDLQSYNKILLSLKERLIGRVLAENISVNNNLLAKKDSEISPKLSAKITQYRDKVLIRSPLTCSFTYEVCQLCYGWSISQGSLVPLGDAVGVIAAQSIGEPGTQLTMRTFHTGGVFSGDLLQEIRAPHLGIIEFSKAFQGLLIRTGHGRIAFLSKTPGSLVLRDHLNSTTIPIQPFTMLFVRQGEKVEINQLLAEFSIQSKEGNQPIKTQQTIFAELSGRVVEDCSGKTYLKYLKESSFLVDNLQHYLSSLVTSPPKTTSPKRGSHAPSTNPWVCKQLVKQAHSNLSLKLPVFSTCKQAPSKESICTGQKFNRVFEKKGISKAQKQSNAINQFLTLYKTEDIENDTFKYVEPVKSGRLGLLKILSIRIGATFNYTCPIKLSGFSEYLQNSLCKSNCRFEKCSYKVNSVCSPYNPFTRTYILDKNNAGSGAKESVMIYKPKAFTLALTNRRFVWAWGEPFVGKSKICIPKVCTSARTKQVVASTSNREICKTFGQKIVQGLQEDLYSKQSTNLIDKKLNLCGGLRKRSRLTRYLHPGLVKDNQFILQTIAEYGDIVEEEYKNKI